MTKEQLLKDLCARLPYGVKFACNKNVYTVKGLDLIVTDEGDWEYAVTAKGITPIEIDFIKPYLFPLSSLTSSDAEAIEHIMGCDIPWNIQYGLLEWTVGGSVESETFDLRIEQIERLMEFLNSNHIDYRGLIEKGLAIDATGLNVYKEETK